MTARLCKLVWSLLAVLPMLATALPLVRAADADGRVAELIRQLGDERYHVRQRARRELAQMGDVAFDALSAAQNDADPEIAAQARFLVRQVRVEWVKEHDPAEVQAILRGYEGAVELVRRGKIRQLAELFECQGAEALCRIVRFEQSEAISKEAARAVMELRPLAGEAPWNELAPVVREQVVRSARPGALWLQAFVVALDEPGTALAQWERLIAAEQQTLVEHPAQTSPALVAQLWHQQARALRRLGQPAKAAAALEATVALEQPDPDSLADLVDRLTAAEGWSAIDLAAQRHQATFADNPLLLYLVARAQQLQGQPDRAEQTAQQAFALHPDDFDNHREVARQLRLRGIAQWQNRELQFIIDKAPRASEPALMARYLLAENLYDARQFQAAADAGRSMLEIIDGETPRTTASAAVASMRSRAHFFQACAHEAAGRREEQMAQLQRGLEQDPKDGDILIALYRLSAGDPAERARTVEKIHQAVAAFREDIEQMPDQSIDYNQLAWLIGNTEGDFDEAVRLSRRSIELQRLEYLYSGTPAPIGGYLDTLAHCYFGQGDYANAVKYQTEAARLDAGSQQIARKLAVFREALAAQQAPHK